MLLLVHDSCTVHTRVAGLSHSYTHTDCSRTTTYCLLLLLLLRCFVLLKLKLTQFSQGDQASQSGVTRHMYVRSEGKVAPLTVVLVVLLL